ncbi:MAG: ATP-dependent DNA ligase [Acidobacteria bacterium]|nr:MAG: ATP-dependent DNA ligase [Acidobacteriota bacterium]
MLLAEIASTSAAVAATRSRLEKVDLLMAALRRFAPEEIEVGSGYLAGVPRQGRMGLGWETLRDARGHGRASTPTLALLEVDAAFERIARTAGKGSAAERRKLLAELMSRATAAEQEFLIRLILGELRQGALEGLVVEAIARAAGVPASDIRRAVMLAGGPAAVARAALVEGPAGLARFRLELGKPVKPMLAQPAGDVDEALAALGEAVLEYKLDGARVQVHKSGDDIRVFSRRLNDVTAGVPEVMEAVRALPARQAILDGEAIALREDGRPQPFQVTMSRFGRKLDVAAARQTLPLSVFFFDCLHLDSQDLIDRPARERIRLLAEELPSGLLVPRLVTSELEAAEEFLRGSLDRGHEGLMAKALDAPYEAGNRGSSWLKVKMAHTLDLVIIAAEWGSGRREGWLSNLHLGARDPRTGGYIMLGKTFKGLTDAMLEWQTGKLRELETHRQGYVVHVRPELVTEIAFNDIQASPHYPAGLALRFARVKRYRQDKTPAEADTIDTVRQIYQRQSGSLEGPSDAVTGSGEP